ncbi:MAG: hypothetical protein J7L41_07840 [Synergistetes bacterium]|nr:hypothetical protein [Synergistota bacterium]
MKTAGNLREMLRSGRTAVGVVVDSYSPTIVEVAGYSGLDFVRIDDEHAWRRDDSMEHMIRAAYVAHITPIVRVDKNDIDVIGKALCLGASGIIVSNIVDRTEVERAVKAAKFPPVGVRGYSSMCFSGHWGARSGREWVEWSDRESVVGIMIENKDAINKLDEIFSVDGLDFALFGFSDYSMSLGFREPKRNHPEVQAALVKTVKVASKYGKVVAVGLGKAWKEDIDRYTKLGCRMIELGHDVAILRRTWAEMRAHIK